MVTRKSVGIIALLFGAAAAVWLGVLSSVRAAEEPQDKAATQPPASEKSAAANNQTAKDAQTDKEDAESDDDKEGNRPLSSFMFQKLAYSNRILKGLMTDDLKLVEDNADRLLKMSHEERWRASNDMMYMQHSTQYRNAVDDLRTKATRNSVDGAALAWINVTMSCIQCHEWVRNVILADTGKTLSGPPNPLRSVASAKLAA
ncbi:MAG: hypothetical protein KDA89_13030 [Planctomycetaceae bacterium]|nr:hypothetical protein [Planctomycetaceae bacterium]